MAKRHGAQFWRAHIEAWERSELTQREYCAQHGLAERGFYRWRRKHKEAMAAANAALTLVPVSVGAPATGAVVRLHSPGGWRIEVPGGNASWLAEFLKHLP
jgi:transposase-like protein